MVKAPVVKSLPDVLTLEEIARIVHATRERRYQTRKMLYPYKKTSKLTLEAIGPGLFNKV